MATISLRNTVDAWVSPDRISKFGDTRLFVHSTANAFLYFARPNLPTGSVITSALLRIYPGTTSGSGSVTVNLHRLTSAFDPNNVSWTSQPGVGSLASTITRSWYSANAPFEFNITSDMQSIINGSAWYGWRLSTPSTDVTQFLYSGQSTYPMELVIDYQSPPAAPTNLYPTGNANVNDPRPTLSWFPAGGVAAQQLAIQLQVASDSGFTTNLYTSNEIATSASSLDLDVAVPAFTALTTGQSRWWRVRVRNDMNLLSNWSVGAQFTYVNAGVVTITAPSGSSTSDPTPVITWTYGAAQKAYQVLIEGPGSAADIAANGIYTTRRLLYDSGILYGTTQSLELPVGIIRFDGGSNTYKLTVRVWNATSVVSVSGVPAYDESSKNFSWVPTGATPPIQLLITQESAPLPPRLIRWEYTGGTAADRFVLTRWRDGVFEAQWNLNAQAPDVREGATTWYRFADRRLPGRANITYTVNTVLASGQASTVAASPSVTVNVDHVLPWVMSTVDPLNRAFCMANAEFDVQRGEISDVVRPVGGPAYLAVQSFGKMEGTAKGIISASVIPGYVNLTSAKMKDNALWIRENQRVLINWADNAIEAFVYQVQVDSQPIPGTTDYVVTFNFVEV